MTDNRILEAIKKFIVENVASKIKLEKPSTDGRLEGEYALVNPAVYVGWIPPKNYLDEYGYDIPSLLIMEDGGEDSTDEAFLNIRIGIATYDPGYTSPEGETTPNVKGYIDLLNLITRIRLELARMAVIEETTSIQKPIKWGLYEEQKYPYWHGWITFQASAVPVNYQDHGIERFL